MIISFCALHRLYIFLHPNFILVFHIFIYSQATRLNTGIVKIQSLIMIESSFNLQFYINKHI
jgi:hypothetical protein